MQVEQRKARTVFITAVENHPPNEWDAFLDEECGENQGLRKRVEALLQAHQGEDSYLDRGDIAVTAEMRSTERAGTQIGPYKLLQQIGEGGMGVVFMAEQTEPVKRRVALKVIKPGMGSRQVMARFEAERQALALMDHPNIAKVLDAATTDSGHPYFVMELVRGVPITQFCDEQHLSPKERLSLFIPVCQAVQHAHQKGIIHRDLKPSNVLVALYDGDPIPKVIDFGVAKATHQQLTDKTMFTQLGQVVGTLEYMSPEQAQMNQLDIDTRSDVYSLGVLLYELLTGATPFDSERLRSAAFDEMLRIIREEDPPPPSVRLSTVDSPQLVAANRRVAPQKLRNLFRGELDWIVLKALEKERARRYETASSLAVDIQSYLDDQPVAACPPSVSYRMRKFVTQYRGLVVAVVAVAISLIAGILGTTIGLVRANNANSRLEASKLQLEEKNRQISRAILHRAFAAAMSGDDKETSYYVQIAKNAGASDAQTDFVLGLVHWANSDFAVATSHLERAAAQDQSSVAVRSQLATVYRWSGDMKKATETVREVRSMSPITAEDHLFSGLAVSIFQPERARVSIEQALKLHDSPIARTMYGLVLTELALKRGERELAQSALEELARAETVLRDNKYVGSAQLSALLAIILLDEQREADTREYRTAAKVCASELLSMANLNTIETLSLASYYEHVEEDIELASTLWQRAVDQQTVDLWSTGYASFLFRHYGPDEAITELARPKVRSAWGRALELQLLVLERDPDGIRRARQEWRELGESGRNEKAWALLLAVLLGDLEDARRVGRNWKKDEPQWLQGLLDYLTDDHADSTNYEEYGDEMKHYVVAIKALGQGNREKAEKHFRRMYSTPYYKNYLYGWAEGFLAQIERSPSWPDLNRDPAQDVDTN